MCAKIRADLITTSKVPVG